MHLLGLVEPSYLWNIGDITMLFSIESTQIDPELIDLLIKKEKEELENTYERPYLQIPILNDPSVERPPIKEESVIVLDL